MGRLLAVKLSLNNCECTNGHGLAPKSGSHFGVVPVPFGLLAGCGGARAALEAWAGGVGQDIWKMGQVNSVHKVNDKYHKWHPSVPGHLGGRRVKKNGFCQYICPWRKLQFIVIL